MTMPDERARSLRFAGEILREILTRQDVPQDLKMQAKVTLRHYPTEQQLKWMARDLAHNPGASGQFWLAPEEDPKV